MPMPKKSQYKILSFSTTMRNPQRMVDFLKILSKFENRKLTHEIIMQIVAELIKNRLYKPFFQKNHYREKLESELEFTDFEIKKIIENSPQNHKEKGFSKGWDSRFDTWYKLHMEFGFCFYEMNEPIIISNVGHMLIDAVSENPTDEIKISNIFLNAMMKYQSNNPYRRVLNENVPLILLLETMQILKEKIGDSKIARQEIPFFTCWRDNDAKSLANYIINFRKKYSGFKYSDDVIYECALKLLQSNNQTRFKKKQICEESIDEYIRKMRITRLITLRGNGFFIDLNSFECEKIDYVLKHYSNYQKFNDKFSYFNFMGKIDVNILDMFPNVPIETQNEIKLKTLQNFAKNYTKDEIYDELTKLANKNDSSKDEVFKIIPEPTRFEFLTSIALKQHFMDLQVIPNYSVDDEGLPTNHAGGNKPDIICFDLKTHALTEVSLICGRTQLSNELIPITRHLKDEINKNPTKKTTFAIFIAPKIHDDSLRYVKFIKSDENLDIKNYTITDFINTLRNSSEIVEFMNV